MGDEVTETTTTETTQVREDNPSTSAQEVVEEVHERQAETAPVVEETTVTKETTVND